MNRAVQTAAAALLLALGFAGGWICRQPVEPPSPTGLEPGPGDAAEKTRLTTAALREALARPGTLEILSVTTPGHAGRGPVTTVEIEFKAAGKDGARHASRFWGRWPPDGAPAFSPLLLYDPVTDSYQKPDDPHGLYAASR